MDTLYGTAGPYSAFMGAPFLFGLGNHDQPPTLTIFEKENSFEETLEALDADNACSANVDAFREPCGGCGAVS